MSDVIDMHNWRPSPVPPVANTAQLVLGVNKDGVLWLDVVAVLWAEDARVRFGDIRCARCQTTLGDAVDDQTNAGARVCTVREIDTLADVVSWWTRAQPSYHPDGHYLGQYRSWICADCLTAALDATEPDRYPRYTAAELAADRDT